VFQTVIAHLHTLSIQVHSYLDDSLIRDFEQQTLVSQTEMVILSTTVDGVTVKEEEGSLLPSLERLEASVEEDNTVRAECGDALAESLP
jgi:hypothetical protein